MAELKIETNIIIDIDTEKMKDVPDEKIQRVIGQILIRFSRWNCNELTILSEGNNNLYCQFWDKDGLLKMTMGAIWRKELQEFTFHT